MKWVIREAKRGDILRVKCGSFYHYGIFISNDEVIQFGLAPNLRDLVDDKDIEVLATSIKVFANGSFVEVSDFSFKEKIKKNSVNKIVEIARSRIGEKGYNLIHNNCEHFVNECVLGEKFSSQTDGIRDQIREKASGR